MTGVGRSELSRYTSAQFFQVLNSESGVHKEVKFIDYGLVESTLIGTIDTFRLRGGLYKMVGQYVDVQNKDLVVFLSLITDNFQGIDAEVATNANPKSY